MKIEISPVILVIDDDAGIAAAVRQVLKGNGSRCILASSCHEAREMVDDVEFLSLQIHGILSDVHLPDGLGHRLIEAFLLRKPDLPVAVMTAYAEEHVLEWMRERPVFFLQKPFRIGRLLDWLQISKNYANRCRDCTEQAARASLKLAGC